MAYIRGEAREQTTMFPVTLDELIPADHVGRHAFGALRLSSEWGDQYIVTPSQLFTDASRWEYQVACRRDRGRGARGMRPTNMCR
jgi:hypothetical protein